jgi:hypothetical protein
MWSRAGKVTLLGLAGAVAFSAGAMAAGVDLFPTGAHVGPVKLGRTILLAKRTRAAGCRLAANPDRRCSPGAYYSGLTKPVICAPMFRTGPIRNVPQAVKFKVEREYGLVAKLYGRTLEIDHIVSLELGGSNDMANLYPEEARFANGAPGYHVKDKLENKLHDLVCSGAISLRLAQLQIARNWQELYRQVYGADPMAPAPAPTTPAPPAPTTPAPAPTTAIATTAAEPTPPAPTTASTATAASGCDPSYPTVCIPPAPPDLDCKDIPYRGFTVLPPDPHRFDGDHDGIGCET